LCGRNKAANNYPDVEIKISKLLQQQSHSDQHIWKV